MATGSRLKVGLGWDPARYGIQYTVYSIKYTLAGVAHSGEWKTKLEAGQRARGWPSEGVVGGFWGSGLGTVCLPLLLLLFVMVAPLP